MFQCSKRRTNKKQQGWMVEKLHSNLVLARGNSADKDVAEFWAVMAAQLNQLGCSRTVREWQEIWKKWAQKIKTKARKIRDHTQRTGGGPPLEQLTDVETKVIEIIGAAAIYGFTENETPLEIPPPVPVLHEGKIDRSTPVPSTSTSSTITHAPPQAASTSPPPQSSPIPPQNPLLASPVSLPSPARKLRRLRGQPLRKRPRPGPSGSNSTIAEILKQNNELYIKSLKESAEFIGNAIREGMTKMAEAIRSLPQ